jgi:hypothetical protein
MKGKVQIGFFIQNGAPNYRLFLLYALFRCFEMSMDPRFRRDVLLFSLVFHFAIFQDMTAS